MRRSGRPAAAGRHPFRRRSADRGPWRHRELTANGIRFHLATGQRFTRDRPLVLLLHGFGEFWWAWRHQLPVLDAAGVSVAALDLRGYGATDKTPRGYRQSVTGSDISAVIRSLGFSAAYVIGHDWGGVAAWSTYAYAPEQVSGLATVGRSAPAAVPLALDGPRPGRGSSCRSCPSA